MPTLENTVPVISAKTLNRKMSRSSVVYSARKAAFYGNAIPRLERAQKILHERLCELRHPVERIDKQGNVVMSNDDQSMCAVIGKLIDVIDAERSLLGFPGPGRRRDEQSKAGDERSKPGMIDLAELAKAQTAEASEAMSPAQAQAPAQATAIDSQAPSPAKL